MSDKTEYTVSVVMPIRNEERYIQRSLTSVLEQDYPCNQIEIIIADGLSEDSSLDIVNKIATKHKNIIIVSNPKKIMPSGANRAIKKASGDVIVLLGGHTVIRSNYITECIETLNRTGADCVGGYMETIGETLIAQSIAYAQSHPFGIGNVSFRTGSKKEELVDTVAFGAYKKEVFDNIGYFDEELVRHQDYEFNLRLRESGGKIVYSPKIESVYFSRATIRKLSNQYFEYGYWKARVFLQNTNAFKRRHFAPALFSLFIVFGGVFSIFFPQLLNFYFGILVLYFFISFVSALLTAQKNKVCKSFPIIPLAFLIIHVGYGIGFWIGLIRWGIFPIKK